MAAATELFRQKGFTETTIDEIADRADVAQRTFFRYFPSKEAVLFAEFEDMHANLLERLALRPLDEAPLVSLYHALHAYVEEIQARFESLSWVVKVAEECAGFGVEKAVMQLRMTANVTDALAARLGVDPKSDPRPAAWASIMLSCFGAAMRASLHGDGNLADTFDQVITEASLQLGALPTGTAGTVSIKPVARSQPG